MGRTMAATPNTASRLHTLLPIRLPAAIMLQALIDNTTLTSNWGAKAPKATTVRPMTMGVTPKAACKTRRPLDQPLAAIVEQDETRQANQNVTTQSTSSSALQAFPYSDAIMKRPE